MLQQLASIPLLLNTLLLWKPYDSPSAILVIWLLRIVTFSLIFRSFVGPSILRLLSKRLRVQSVSLRSVRGIYFRTGRAILHVERVGIGYHRPSPGNASRFSIRVEGVRLEVVRKAECKMKNTSSRKRRRCPTLQDLAPFPLALSIFNTLRSGGLWIYTAVEPFVRPIVRAIIVSALRVMIRALPALTQVFDFELDSAVVMLQSVPGAEFAAQRVKVYTSVAFTQLDNSANSGGANKPFVQQSRHKRFASVADFGTRLKNSFRRSWERAWGTTQVAASLSVNIQEILCVASRPLLDKIHITSSRKHTFLSLPNIVFSTSVRLDPRQQIERHGFEASLASDAVSVDLDIVQYILEHLKELRRQEETDKMSDGALHPYTQTSFQGSPLSLPTSPSQSGLLTPPSSISQPRPGWASPMSPKSPLMEALSVHFRWRKHHPVRRISGRNSTPALSVLKSINISFPGFTLMHRLTVSPDHHPETFKVTLAQIDFQIKLSHPDRVPLHRECLGRSSGHGDPLTADVYAVTLSINQAAVDRIGTGTIVDHLRVIALGHSHAAVLVSQWPSHWLYGPSFLAGDPNSQFVAVNICMGGLEITEHLEVIQKILSRTKPQNSHANTEPNVALPPVLAPVPRVTFGFYLQSIAVRLISTHPTDSITPFALEAHTDGFTLSASTRFLMLPDRRFAKFPTDPHRPRLQMDIDFHAILQRTFINVNRGMQDSLEGALSASMYPGEPVISMDSIEFSGEGCALGEMADEAGGGVTIDVPSIFLETRCASDALSIELWQPDAVNALRIVIASFSRGRPESKQTVPPTAPSSLLGKLPSGLSASLAIGRFMVFITSPDLTPGEDLNISRGTAAHTGVSLQYCSLRDKHCHGSTNLLARTQKRLQLSLETELVTKAVGKTTTAALTQTRQALVQFSLWNLALRDAVSTRFVADDPYGVSDISEDHRSQEYLRIKNVSLHAELFGARADGLPSLTIKDKCAVAISVANVRGYLHLAHAYNLLLATYALRSLIPPKRQPRPVSASPSAIALTMQCDIDKIQLIWEFPLRMKLYTRISSMYLNRIDSGRLTVGWNALLLAVSLDVERNGILELAWEELARLPKWIIDVHSHVKPVTIVAEGDSLRLRIPFDYVLADLILDMNVTLKSLKYLVQMVPSGIFSNPSAPVPEEAKSMPNLHVRVGCLCAEAADDEFESRLGLIWRAGFEAARLRLERDDAFEAKVATILTANSETPSTPARDTQTEFQFTTEHTVPIEEARSRLYHVHSGAWKSRFRQVHARQVHREETHVPTSSRRFSTLPGADDELVKIRTPQPVPPLIRLKLDGLSLHLSRPSFASNNLPDFLFREGGGIPRDTQYSLLIPMHLTFSVASFRVTCREYPLPMLNIPPPSNKDIPGLEFDSDLVIAEEMGAEQSVEWIDCAIVKSDTGIHGASALFIAIPKTLNPVKTYANPVIRVKSDDITDFAWGVSYGPATQDIMRVVDTLSHAPRDSSPPIGFWDKLRLVFHWRLKVFFEREVHLHMKGSHDPQGLRGKGAGFAFCWQGSPQLLINQPNEQNEVVQVVSDSMLIIIPNIEESWGESSTMGAHDETRHTPLLGKSHRSRKVCAKFGSGSRFGVGMVLERTCGPDCPACYGDAFHRKCRFFDFKPHYEVILGTKEHKPLEKSPEDSYNGFRSDFIHLSISLTSSLRRDTDEYSSIHLSPSVFDHFWAWWGLFDGKAPPIRQGRRYKHKRPLAPKFGRHLATIKYRIEVPRLFLSHVYVDDSRDAWADGVTPFVGVKAMAGHFQADMHQRAQESITIAPDGTSKKAVHKPFDAIEVVMKELELRAVLAIFDEPLKQCVQLEPTYLQSGYRKRSDLPLMDASSPWIDLDDFSDRGWIPKDAPKLHMLPALSCPRFTYFRRTPVPTESNRVERSKFGSEKSHVCLLGREASVPQVQIEIVEKRITELRESLKDKSSAEKQSIPSCPDNTDTNYMISLLEDYVTHLRRVDARSRIIPSNGPQNYYMPADTVSPDEWGEFTNVYQVHCPKVYLDNSIRDIMMQYYYCSRSRRGMEYHMATRAVKFIRDQALAAVEQLQHGDPMQKERRGTAASATQAAAHAVRKILSGADALLSPTIESSPEPLFHTVSNRDPLKGWSKGVSLQKGHFCLLLKPQIVLHSEASTDAVCVLAAVQGKLQTYNIVDDANADDPISGKVMSRNFASLDGLQAFSPSASNTLGTGVVPLEILIDLRCGSNYFDRLVPQTEATFLYDKFNRLRLRNNVTSSLAAKKTDVDDQLHNHLHSQNDLVRVHVPRFTVSAKDRHFQAISNIVTNLLLFSDAAHKTRMERLEKMLFNYDFTNLGSAADVVSKLQARLRMAVETRREAETKLQGLGDPGQVEKYKIKAHILLLGEELDYVFEAIKLAQDKASDKAAQKSALLFRALSDEISWRMLDRHDQLLAKLAVRDIDFRWLNRQDSSTVNRLIVGDLQAFDGAADAEWTEILSKYDEPSNHPMVKRKQFCLANWTVLPPVGGITIYQSFELMLHPMRLQIDTRVGRKIMEYVWPARRKRHQQRTITISTPETEDFRLPPSPTPSPAPLPSERLSLAPRLPRRLSEDLPSSRSNPITLGVPTLRKSPTSRSFSDLRKAASDSLQVPGLHRTRSQEMLSFTASSSGHGSKTSDDSRERILTSRRYVADDATVMKTRSSQKTFIWVKVSSLHLLLSIMKENSFLCRDARIQTRDLEYRNQTWSFEELVDQFIPSGRNWKGWVKMAFNQPLVPVLPVARELISKTKWVNMKHLHDTQKRGSETPRSLPFISRDPTPSGSRQRTLSTLTPSRKNATMYKTENQSTPGLLTTDPEPLLPASDLQDEDVPRRKAKNKILKAFRRRRPEPKTRVSIDSTDSARTTSTSSSWTPEVDNAPDTPRPFNVRTSLSDSTL